MYYGNSIKIVNYQFVISIKSISCHLFKFFNLLLKDYKFPQKNERLETIDKDVKSVSRDPSREFKVSKVMEF